MLSIKKICLIILMLLCIPLVASAGKKTVVLGVSPTEPMDVPFCPPGYVIEARMFTEGSGGWRLESENGVPFRLVQTPYGAFQDRLVPTFGCRVGSSCYLEEFDHKKDGVIGLGDVVRALHEREVANPGEDKGNYIKREWARLMDPTLCRQVTFPDEYDPAKHLFIACVNATTREALLGYRDDVPYDWRGPARVVGSCQQ